MTQENQQSNLLQGKKLEENYPKRTIHQIGIYSQEYQFVINLTQLPN